MRLLKTLKQIDPGYRTRNPAYLPDLRRQESGVALPDFGRFDSGMAAACDQALPLAALGGAAIDSKQTYRFASWRVSV